LTLCKKLRWRDVVNDHKIITTALKPSAELRQHTGANYSKVFDQRKRRVRGLWGRWRRFGTYYTQITVPDETTC